MSPREQPQRPYVEVTRQLHRRRSIAEYVARYSQPQGTQPDQLVWFPRHASAADFSRQRIVDDMPALGVFLACFRR